jgi:phycocyanin beta chain
VASHDLSMPLEGSVKPHGASHFQNLIYYSDTARNFSIRMRLSKLGRWLRLPRGGGFCLAWCLLIPPLISAGFASRISWTLIVFILPLIILEPLTRQESDNKSDDRLMVIVPYSITIILWTCKEKWAATSDTIPWIASILLAFTALQLLSATKVLRLFGNLGIRLLSRAIPSIRVQAEALWLDACSKQDRLWYRLLQSKTMALWPVFASVTAAIIGLPDWTPTWRGDRSILVVMTGALAFYGQRRGSYEQAQLESRIGALVAATKLAEQDFESAEGDLEAERTKQGDLLEALDAEKASATGITGNIDKLAFDVSNKGLRLSVVERITSNAKRIVTASARKLFELHPYLVAPGGSLNTESLMAACLRDLEIILRYITYATFLGDASVLEERCLNGLREIYQALGVPADSAVAGFRIMEKYTVQAAISSDELNISEIDAEGIYEQLRAEIASYFDLVENALR